MRFGPILAIAMSICGTAVAADPATSRRAHAAIPRVAGAELRPRLLDLRVPDLRRILTPEEYQELVMGREEDRNTVVIEAEAPLLPMKSDLDVPGGIMAPFWALANPTQAWRIFLPDPRVNIKNIPPPESKIPPPAFDWGPKRY